jgi:hypothetical protein
MASNLIPVGCMPLLDFVHRDLFCPDTHRQEQPSTFSTPAGEQTSITIQDSDRARGSHHTLSSTHNRTSRNIQDRLTLVLSLTIQQESNARINRARARSIQATPQKMSMKEMLSRAPVE